MSIFDVTYTDASERDLFARTFRDWVKSIERDITVTWGESLMLNSSTYKSSGYHLDRELPVDISKVFKSVKFDSEICVAPKIIQNLPRTIICHTGMCIDGEFNEIEPDPIVLESGVLYLSASHTHKTPTIYLMGSNFKLRNYEFGCAQLSKYTESSSLVMEDLNVCENCTTSNITHIIVKLNRKVEIEEFVNMIRSGVIGGVKIDKQNLCAIKFVCSYMDVCRERLCYSAIKKHHPEFMTPYERVAYRNRKDKDMVEYIDPKDQPELHVDGWHLFITRS